MTTPSRFVVKTSQAKCPGKWQHPRVSVAVIETTDGLIPYEISTRPLNVVRVVAVWRAQYSGSTERCQASRALAEANRIAERYNERDAVPAVPAFARLLAA